MTHAVTLAIETGGTKIIARLAAEDRVLAENRWPTTTPEAAHRSIVDWATSQLPDRSKVSAIGIAARSEEHTSELQSLLRTSYAVFCLKTTKLYICNTQST